MTEDVKNVIGTEGIGVGSENRKKEHPTDSELLGQLAAKDRSIFRKDLKKNGYVDDHA